MKNNLFKRIVSVLMILMMVLSVMPEVTKRAYAADATAYSWDDTSASNPTGQYILFAGLTGWNSVHKIEIGGSMIPVYCVEPANASPGNIDYNYYALDSLLTSGRGYDEDVLNGLCTIMELGYPITTTVNGVSLSAEEAQVATQFAVRMWLSSKGVSNVHPNINNDNLTAGGSRKESPTFKNRTSATIKN